MLIFEERRVRRALRRLMRAVCREGCQLALRSGPSRLLPKISRQDEERLPIEALESLVLAEEVDSSANSSRSARTSRGKELNARAWRRASGGSVLEPMPSE